MLETAARSLAENGYDVKCFETAAEAAEYISSEISGKTVGIGGSVTVAQMGLYELLCRNNTVYWHNRLPDGMTDGECREKANGSDIYISSVNGLSAKGEIVNIDNICNRVAAMLYGHERVYLIAGRNKIAPDEQSAVYRARNIAAPMNAKRLGRKTPCAVTGKCSDCDSPDRICRGLSVLWKKPALLDVRVILINEDLGY